MNSEPSTSHLCFVSILCLILIYVRFYIVSLYSVSNLFLFVCVIYDNSHNFKWSVNKITLSWEADSTDFLWMHSTSLSLCLYLACRYRTGGGKYHLAPTQSREQPSLRTQSLFAGGKGTGYETGEQPGLIPTLLVSLARPLTGCYYYPGRDGTNENPGRGGVVMRAYSCTTRVWVWIILKR